MNLYGDVKSFWFDPTDSDPGDAEAKVDGRCRLRMLVLRTKGDVSSSTSIQFKDGSGSGSVLYEIDVYESTDRDANQSQIVDMGEHGILFSDGIYADYTKATVWCDSALVIYS